MVRAKDFNARFFNGKRYTPVHVTRFKRDADEEARKIRNRGNSARVVTGKSEGQKYYVVYSYVSRW